MSERHRHVRLAKWLGAAAVMVIATLTALSGNQGSLPLETHEAFVARSAEEMIANDSWLIPEFGGEVSLKKPPLAYWLVIAID